MSSVISEYRVNAEQRFTEYDTVGFYDEMFDDNGVPRPPAKLLAARLKSLCEKASVGPTGFTYRFVQSTGRADSLELTIQAGDAAAGRQIFNGSYAELKTFWEEELGGG